MRAVITGAAGLIGAHLCNNLLKRGYEVVAIDNLAKGTLDNLETAQKSEKFRFIQADVCDQNFTQCYREGADVVVHLAAGKIPRYGGRLETLTVNSQGSFNAFEMARLFKCKLVFASTSDVLGRNDKIPLTEEDLPIFGGPEVARWAYAVSKFYEEHLGFAFAEKYQIPIVCMRFFASYGPYQHRSWSGGPVPVFIEQAIKNQPITLHGDGQQTRTFCYAEDTVEGVARCVVDNNANGHVFNIGNPSQRYSVLELAKMVSKLIAPNREPKIEMVPYETFGKYEDIRHRVPDVSKIQRVLNFTPSTDLKTGLEKTIEWQRRYY